MTQDEKRPKHLYSPDSHGESFYPSDEVLEFIEQYEPDETIDIQEFITLIEILWWARDWGFKRGEDTLELHTGGWSGNEDIINSLLENDRMPYYLKLMWSSIGGHYCFKIITHEKQVNKGSEGAQEN